MQVRAEMAEMGSRGHGHLGELEQWLLLSSAFFAVLFLVTSPPLYFRTI